MRMNPAARSGERTGRRREALQRPASSSAATRPRVSAGRAPGGKHEDGGKLDPLGHLFGRQGMLCAGHSATRGRPGRRLGPRGWPAPEEGASHRGKATRRGKARRRASHAAIVTRARAWLTPTLAPAMVTSRTEPNGMANARAYRPRAGLHTMATSPMPPITTAKAASSGARANTSPRRATPSPPAQVAPARATHGGRAVDGVRRDDARAAAGVAIVGLDLVAEPGDGLGQALVQRNAGLPPQHLPRLGDVGLTRLRIIAGRRPSLGVMQVRAMGYPRQPPRARRTRGSSARGGAKLTGSTSSDRSRRFRPSRSDVASCACASRRHRREGLVTQRLSPKVGHHGRR